MELEVKKISAEDGITYLEDEKYLFVDTRSVDEYIGWPINIDVEGHIEKAMDFPLKWFSMGDKAQIKKELEKRGIGKEKTLIIYDNFGNIDGREFIQLGYSVMILKDGIKGWNDKGYPIEKLERYHTYVYPKWIDDLNEGRSISNYDGRRYVILEVNSEEEENYKIKNSIFLDHTFLNTEEMWNKPEDEEIEKILLEKGISKTTMVILYGPNIMATHRCAAVMRYAGVEDIRILNGGTKRLIDENYQFVKGYIEPTPISEFGGKIPGKKEAIIDFEEELRLVHSPNGVIVSIRSWKEYIGEVTGYSYIHKRGDIANSRYGYGGSDPYNMEDYRNIDNTIFNYNLVRERWKKWGITPDKEVSFHCGTGWRASEAYFYAEVMGWKDIHVYDGGWYEWQMREDRPRKPFGIPKDAPVVIEIEKGEIR